MTRVFWVRVGFLGFMMVSIVSCQLGFVLVYPGQSIALDSPYAFSNYVRNLLRVPHHFTTHRERPLPFHINKKSF